VTELRDHWVRRAFSHREDIARSFVDREHWADADETLDANNSLWKQYAILVDLYKYYLEIAWKVAVWYYATTGAVLAFYFNNVSIGGSTPLPYLLLFLAAISVGFAYLHLRGARNLNELPHLLEYIARTLRIPGRPHVEFAIVFLLMNCAMFMFVALGCLIAFVATV
jgi:hypothetical protein